LVATTAVALHEQLEEQGMIDVSGKTIVVRGTR